ncbi:MAG: GerAB/ArcD/ProY family transporter, partial [Bacillota bacterium]
RGALLIQTWLIESVIVLQLVPLVKDSKRIRRNTTISIIMLGIGLEMGVLTVALFGPITKNFIFPALQFVRFASLGEYFRGLDISIMGVWIAGIFIKLAVFYYVFVTGLVQLLGLKAYKQLIVPAGIIIISFSMVVSRSIMEFTHFLHFIFPLYSLVIAFILPAFLLIISVFRNKKPADKSI